MGILKRNLTSVIGVHGTLHGFRVGKVMMNASLEPKLLQHLTAMREAVMYKLLLDLQKVYAALDRYR